MSKRVTYKVEFRDPTGDTAAKSGLTPDETLELVGKAEKAHLAIIVTPEVEQ